MHDIPFLYLKEKICKEHQKKKKIKMLLYGCKLFFRRCGNYMMYLKGDGPHQTVMIVCECS